MKTLEKTALYRHWDEEGALLYVGITQNPLRRLSNHMQNSPWADLIMQVTMEWYDSRDEAIQAEKQAIEDGQPIHNLMRPHVSDALVKKRATQKAKRRADREAYKQEQARIAREVEERKAELRAEMINDRALSAIEREEAPREPSRLLTIQEVSERLGLTPGALATMRYEKRGPAYTKLSAKQVRYPEDKLDAWIEAQTQTPGQEAA